MNGEPYYFTLGVPDLERGRAFYAELFGWDVTAEGHIANLALGGGIAPADYGLGPTLYLRCDDVPAGVARVRELGGTSTDPTTSRSGDHAQCIDDQGTAFSIGWTHAEMEAEQAAGLASLPAPKAELGYLTIGTPDVDRAAAFYGGLFGWEAEPAAPSSVGGAARYRHVTSTELPLGLVDHDLDQRLHLYFKVADVAATAEAVGRLGGHADAIVKSDSGLSADGRDDQGMPFSLWEPAPGY